MWRLVISRALFCGTLACFVGCGGGSTNHRPDAVPERPTPSLRLLVVTDIDGALEPCGCNSRPLGGIDRMAAELRGLRDQAPSLVVVAGNTFVGPEHSDEPAFAEQARLGRATLLEILREMHVDLLAPGPADLSLGTERLSSMMTGESPVWLSADVTTASAPAEQDAASDPGAAVRAPALRAGRVQRVGDVKVGVFAVLNAGVHAGLRGPEAPLESARRALATLRDQGAEFVVAVASTQRRTTRRIARLEGVDLVLQAGLDRAEPLPPSSEGGALVLNAGRQGQRLMVVDVYRRGDGSFVDVSAWTQRAQAGSLRAQASSLAAQIASWEREGSANADAIATQRARLTSLESRATAAENATQVIPEQGNVLAARLLELSPEAPRDDAIRHILSAHDLRVGESNRRVWADIEPTAVHDGQPSYVGAERCGDCHAAAFRWWQTTPHGHAYATLEGVGKQFDLDCVGCHLTGYRRPGGSNITHVGALHSVGCEVCHGPGSGHATAPTAVALEASPDAHVCLRCHTEAHSDLFDFDAYRAMLRVPGHGIQETP